MSQCEAKCTECEPLAASSGHTLQLQQSDLSPCRNKVVMGRKLNTFTLTCFKIKGEAEQFKLSIPCRRKPAGNRHVSNSDSAPGRCAALELQTYNLKEVREVKD